MSLVGTPSEALLAKITSDEVSGGHLGTAAILENYFIFLVKVITCESVGQVGISQWFIFVMIVRVD